jgi:hypothetical protein
MKDKMAKDRKESRLEEQLKADLNMGQIKT